MPAQSQKQKQKQKPKQSKNKNQNGDCVADKRRKNLRRRPPREGGYNETNFILKLLRAALMRGSGGFGTAEPLALPRPWHEPLELTARFARLGGGHA
ncbi:hypothetical protein [Paraburkholderia azotifigens]|uniref:Uncharacterized protein n=1 Tax=Paraburkholderia azotifigens TaxID=2057004 RepID=A0A5C6VN16_9BURK|nr:hypothetical protein [Paraburkholderia azotifigens]TXC86164.1 hypothetical protein FRZ40_00445 [Paraburkholderia azotifigens]